MSTENQPTRVQRKRTRGFRSPVNTIYVGRPTKWGNPFRVIGEDELYCIVDAESNYWRVYEDRPFAIERTVQLYANWIEGKVASGQLDISELIGKNLSCYCPIGMPCHADVLLQMANSLTEANGLKIGDVVYVDAGIEPKLEWTITGFEKLGKDLLACGQYGNINADLLVKAKLD